MSEKVRAPRPAATVLMLRDGASGPEVFMVKRHQKSGFMGGAYVFPGGRVDDADGAAAVLSRLDGVPSSLSDRLGEEIEESFAAALFVAAARETLEEAGVWLGSGSPKEITQARKRLWNGEVLGVLLEELGLRLDTKDLVPWARWVTPEVESKRFDARFFLASVGHQTFAAHDDRETVDSAWLSPRAALARFDKGEIQLPPPTHRSLWLLRDKKDTSSILREAERSPVPKVCPRFVPDEHGGALVLPGDPGHPEAEEVIPGPSRFVQRSGRWAPAEESSPGV